MISSLIIFITYAIICYLLFGITKDFSRTYYKWKENYPTKKYHLMFPFWILGISFPMMAFFNYTNWWTDWMVILGCVLLWLVFFAPNYKYKPFNIIHVIGSMGGISVLILYGLTTSLWFLQIPFLVFMLLLKKNKINLTNTTYWVELFAYFTIFTTLYFH
jgi:hypothetical protein